MEIAGAHRFASSAIGHSGRMHQQEAPLGRRILPPMNIGGLLSELGTRFCEGREVRLLPATRPTIMAWGDLGHWQNASPDAATPMNMPAVPCAESWSIAPPVPGSMVASRNMLHPPISPVPWDGPVAAVAGKLATATGTAAITATSDIFVIHL